MNNKWSQVGNTFTLREVSYQLEALPPGVYKLCQDGMTKALFLERVADGFVLPDPYYGIENAFVERVLTTYRTTSSNLGILLNGQKGTGKTQVCERLCNLLGLPVILVSDAFDGLTSFINDIQDEAVLFFDEYEKTFPNDWRTGSKLLGVMDGALKSASRKVFLLTTNELHIDANFIQRPGRVRYLKTFDNLDVATILQIVQDRLTHSEFQAAVVDFVSQLELITVDIVTAVVDEVNIHNEPPEAFASVFNVRKVQHQFNVYRITAKGPGEPTEERIVGIKVSVTPFPLDKSCVEADFHVNRKYLGEIVDVQGDLVYIQEEVEGGKEDETRIVVYRCEALSGRNALFLDFVF